MWRGGGGNPRVARMSKIHLKNQGGACASLKLHKTEPKYWLVSEWRATESLEAGKHQGHYEQPYIITLGKHSKAVTPLAALIALNKCYTSFNMIQNHGYTNNLSFIYVMVSFGSISNFWLTSESLWNTQNCTLRGWWNILDSIKGLGLPFLSFSSERVKRVLMVLEQ